MKKRNINQGFIDCPFDEEDVISESYYDDLKSPLSLESSREKKISKPKSDLYFYQSKTNQI